MPTLVASGLTENEFIALKARLATEAAHQSDLGDEGEHAPTKQVERLPWPESTSASMTSKWTFSFMAGLLALGARPEKTLSPDDLFECPTEESSAALAAIFQARYREDSNKKGERGDDSNDPEGFWRMVRALWAVVRSLMIEAGWCNLMACSLQVNQPTHNTSREECMKATK